MIMQQPMQSLHNLFTVCQLGMRKGNLFASMKPVVNTWCYTYLSIVELGFNIQGFQHLLYDTSNVTIRNNA